jgi:S-adenosylmethionine-diacylgycerolhomoserine-N-methlytransferase
MSSTSALAGYYRFHAGIYDATRWSFLFGRNSLLKTALAMHETHRVLEIGCGTGHNLRTMCQHHSSAHFTGIDLSAAMLEKAWRNLRRHAGRVRLIHQSYDHPLSATGDKFDLVICSYALSMFNPGWEQAIDCACKDLAPGGLFALVDFHHTNSTAFRRWMEHNHVRMEGHLREHLTATFQPLVNRTTKAYGGLWEYLTFIGRARM